MTDTFRALCAELVELSAPVDSISQLAERLQKLNELADRARALLAEPEPEWPTDEELEEEFGAALLKLPGDSMNTTAVAFARAVLARWGRPAAAPVPVSELGEQPVSQPYRLLLHGEVRP